MLSSRLETSEWNSKTLSWALKHFALAVWVLTLIQRTGSESAALLLSFYPVFSTQLQMILCVSQERDNVSHQAFTVMVSARCRETAQGSFTLCSAVCVLFSSGKNIPWTDCARTSCRSTHSLHRSVTANRMIINRVNYCLWIINRLTFMRRCAQDLCFCLPILG